MISSHLHDDVQKRFSRRCSMQSWAWKKPMLNSRFGPVNFILDPQYRHWNNWWTKSGLLKQCYSIYVLPNQRCSVGFCQWTGPLMATWNLTKLTPLTHCNHGWCKKPCLWRQWSSWRNHSFPIPYAVMVEMAYSSSVYKYTSSQFVAPWHLANIRPSKSWKLTWPSARSRKYPGVLMIVYFTISTIAIIFFSCFMLGFLSPRNP